MPLVIYSPLSGEVVPIESVSDPVFAEKMLGDGVAIIPDEGIMCAPTAGVITALPQSGHACGITTSDGQELLIHVGIDTVEMDGKGFTLLASKDQNVNVGDDITRFDIEAIKEAGKDTVSPVVICNAQVKVLAGNHIKRGEPLLEVLIEQQ